MLEPTELTETTPSYNQPTTRLYAQTASAIFVYQEYFDPKIAEWQMKRLNDRWGKSGSRYSLTKPEGFLEPSRG